MISRRSGTTRDERCRQRHRRCASIAVVLLGMLVSSPKASGIGPKELFQAGGIGEGQWKVLGDSDDWQSEEKDVLRRMMYRVQKDVRASDLEQWSLGKVDVNRLTEDPTAYQGQVFQLRGRVVRVYPYPLSDRPDDPAAFASIWRCRMILEDSARQVDVFSADVPNAWPRSEPIDEPSGAMAFFLVVSNGDDGNRARFLAEHMAWYPDTYLGRLGMDVALFDQVPVEPPPSRDPDGATPTTDWETRELTTEDHECFYQLLAAVGRAEDGQLREWAEEQLARRQKPRYSVVPLFNAPQTQQGQLVELSGVARRIVPVRVGEREVRQRFGIREYYQIFLFTEDSQDNPLVFCLRQLPKGLPTGDGPGFGEYVTVAGFFFKTWSYRTGEVSDDGNPQRQLAPLLIGKTALWHPPEAPHGLSTTAQLAGIVVLLIALGVVWWVFRQFTRGDRDFERRIRRRAQPEVADTDWEALDSRGSEHGAENEPGEST